MSTTSYTYIALNGSDHTDTTDAIARRHMAEAEAFLEAHAAELYEKQDRDERKMVYGAEYFVEVGGDYDEDGEFDVAATLEAHDINTDQYDHIEAHGIYDVSDVQCYAEIGTKDQRERARDLALIDTRADAMRECKAGRAKQVAKRLSKAPATRAETIVAAKQSANERKRERARQRYLEREAQRAAVKAAKAERTGPRFTDAESNAARADRAAEKRLDDYLNR